jgi:hypothetical protein
MKRTPLLVLSVFLAGMWMGRVSREAEIQRLEANRQKFAAGDVRRALETANRIISNLSRVPGGKTGQGQ